MASETQTVIFDKEKWELEAAKTWLGEHDLRSDKVDENENSYRFRQFSPERCRDGSYQTLTENMPDGVSMVVCDTEKCLAIQMEEEPIRKFYAAEQKTLRNGDVEAYVSTETPDRVGDVIVASGWDLTNYKKTGSPVLFGHYYGALPGGAIPHIGKAIECEVQRNGLWAVTRFHEKTQLSKDCAMLARDGDMTCWSVGFSPTEKPEIRKGEQDEFLGMRFTKTDLYEYSLVPVPANAEATTRAVQMMEKGTISRNTFHMLRQSAAFIAGLAPSADGDSGSEGEAIKEAFDAWEATHALRAGR